jgi:hypothetical protein
MQMIHDKVIINSDGKIQIKPKPQGMSSQSLKDAFEIIMKYAKILEAHDTNNNQLPSENVEEDK